MAKATVFNRNRRNGIWRRLHTESGVNSVISTGSSDHWICKTAGEQTKQGKVHKPEKRNLSSQHYGGSICDNATRKLVCPRLRDVNPGACRQVVVWIRLSVSTLWFWVVLALIWRAPLPPPVSSAELPVFACGSVLSPETACVPPAAQAHGLQQ